MPEFHSHIANSVRLLKQLSCGVRKTLSDSARGCGVCTDEPRVDCHSNGQN
jgi:hypothetical protein